VATLAFDFLKKYGFFLVVILALLAGIAYLHHTAYADGYKAGSSAVQDKWDAQTAQAATAAAKAASAATIQQQSNTQVALSDASAGATQQTAVKTVFKTIYQKANTYAQDHPNSPDCQLGNDGVSLWDAANAGPVTPASNPASGPGDFGSVAADVSNAASAAR
jgi:hypothetical protein